MMELMAENATFVTLNWNENHLMLTKMLLASTSRMSEEKVKGTVPIYAAKKKADEAIT